jgi:uncharacterized repeat protein (TIGR01451 family)
MTLLRTLRCRGFAALAAGLLLALGGGATAQAQTTSSCAPAATKGTAPDDFRDYCWLDFEGYSDAQARGTAGQDFRFNLPDGTRITLNLKVTNANGTGSGNALRSVAVPSWSGSAFGNSGFIGIPGRPVLYNDANGTTSRVNLRNIQVTPPAGGTANYSIIVADGESSNDNESLVFYTNRNNWERVASIANGTQFPTQSPAGTTGLGATVTLTGRSGTVGSYVYRTDNNPTEVRATLDGGGLQGVIFGVRYASVAVVSRIAGSRYYPADQFNYSLRTGAGVTLVDASTTGTATDGFAPAVMPTVAASYPFHVVQAMAPGSAGTLANYTTTLTCVNANTASSTPLPVNQPVSSYVFNNLQYRDSITCTFTNSPIFSSVAGTVYADANANGSQDGGEAGTGVAGLFVKLAPVSGGACTGPAHQAVPVAAATGAFQASNVPQGNYCLVLDNNATLNDITPALPAGWIGLENGAGSVQVSVPAGSNPESPQRFGMFNGSRLAGSVFADTGTGGGVANDGIRQAGEAGVSGLVVRATAGATTVASATTVGDGSFTLWLPAGAGALAIGPAQVPTGQLASGGSAGTTGGAFARPNLNFTPAAGQQYTGVAIGLVPGIELAPNGSQTALPGTAVFHPHTFKAGSGGQVAFSLAATATPALSGWTAILYRDSNCSATLEASEPVLAAPLAVQADETVCVVVKQFVPAEATSGAQNALVLTAQFTFTNAAPALSANASVTDLTVVGEPAALVLHKRVGNVTRGGPTGTSVNASPGDVLQYTLVAQNQGSAPLTTLVINDTTAAFTTFVSAACPGALPAGISACSVAAQPAAGTPGALRWTFTGSLAPGAQLTVSYRVQLDQ